MMDGRCATCRWWEHYGANPKSIYLHYRQSDDVHCGVCLLATKAGHINIPVARMSVELEGQEGPAWLETRDDFGCIQWEPTP